MVIGGPTASSKTTLAIQLSQYFDAPILSADSRQFYHEMCIGNARPTKQELQQAQHFFVADRSVSTPLSAGDFAKEATVFLAKHFEKSDTAIVVGGSGLFIKALTDGLDFFPKIPDEIRAAVDQLFLDGGIKALQQALKKADPNYYEVVDQANHARLKRALEVCMAGDYPFSYYRKQAKSKQIFIPVFLQTAWPRAVLYQRINTRVDQMIAQGLEEEALHLVKYQNLAALKTVGYQEWFAYFNGDYDRNRAIELIKQHTRRYAKRQLTWFRRDGHWKQIFKADIRSALAYIHLVQTENISLLAKPSMIDESKHPQYKSILTELGRVEAAPLGSTLIWKGKKMACLKQWDFEQLSHAAQTVLWHECLHRAEMEEVFAAVTEKEQPFFESMGFRAVENQKELKCFKDETISAKRIFVWNRSQQKF